MIVYYYKMVKKNATVVIVKKNTNISRLESDTFYFTNDTFSDPIHDNDYKIVTALYELDLD